MKNINIIRLYLFYLLFVCIIPLFISAQKPDPEIKIYKIWDFAEHNAFTDLIKFKGDYYCSFREGSGHVPGRDGTDGVVRILKSKDGKEIFDGKKILLATVKGDIHDIGKNIVKLILENYGYKIIDLGKDVDIKKVVETVIKENIMLVGLSALMTTTVKNMEYTIHAIKKESPQVKIMVGGAVLTPDYAATIGADYYAKDAREAVEIAKKAF